MTTNGKRKIVFSPDKGFIDMPVSVPCGQCIGCRLERSRQWAIRCVHEASLYDMNSFITLTYDSAHLPSDGSLNKSHFQKFMKRLRKRYSHRIRFFHCGEYGSKNKRPHYHACLFNHDFNDKELWSIRDGVRLYISESLQKLWPYGFSTIGDVTFESAAYVARYIMKKVTGDKAEEHYLNVNTVTGELTALVPEYTTMSRRPGIAADWFKQFKSDVYPSDFIVMRGKKMKPPRYYDTIYELDSPDDFFVMKALRKRTANLHKEDNTTQRLCDREKVKKAQLNKLIRPYEDNNYDF